MAAKGGKSILMPKLCLKWETEKPLAHETRESPVFRFMNCDWGLKLTYCKWHPSDYRVSIEKKSTEQKFPAFSVDTYFENPRKITDGVLQQRTEVSNSPCIIWTARTSDLLEKVPQFDEYGDFTLVFVFQRNVQQPNQSGIKDVFKVPLTFKDPLALEEVAVTSLDVPLSFDSLSNEFANMLEKNIFSDVKLKSGDRVIPAHKAVLAARSEVFAAMFRHDMSESSSGVISIEDFDTPVVDAFLRYLYSGKIAGFNLTEDFVMKLYAVSDKYAVYALRKICSLYMIKNITCDNFIRFLCFADSHSDKELKNAIICIIIKTDSWLKKESWLRFASENTILATEVFCKYFSK